MKRLITVSMILILSSFSLFAQKGVKFEKFNGAWFSILYPANFTAKGSMKSYAGEGYDSAIFTSPDKTVEFYIFSPQWNGENPEIDLKPNEKMGKPSVSHNKKTGRTVTMWTITAKDGSYSRSYRETIESNGAARWVVGIKYKDKASYDKYRSQYVKFRDSLEQFADGYPGDEYEFDKE